MLSLSPGGENGNYHRFDHPRAAGEGGQFAIRLPAWPVGEGPARPTLEPELNKWDIWNCELSTGRGPRPFCVFPLVHRGPGHQIKPRWLARVLSRTVLPARPARPARLAPGRSPFLHMIPTGAPPSRQRHLVKNPRLTGPMTIAVNQVPPPTTADLQSHFATCLRHHRTSPRTRPSQFRNLKTQAMLVAS